MLARFARDGAIYSCGALISAGIRIAVLPLYACYLDAADFGIVDLVTLAGTIVTLTLPLEVSQGVARFYADAADASERQVIASTGLWFSIAVLSLFTVAAMLCADELALWLFGREGLGNLVMIGAVCIWSNAILVFAQNQLRWALLPKKYALVATMQSLIAPVAAAGLILGCEFRASGILFGQMSANLAGCALALWWSRSCFRMVFDAGVLKNLLKFSIPLVPSSLGMIAATYLDRIAIRELMSLDDLGRYGIAFRVASLVTILVAACQSAVTPLVYAHHQRPETRATIARLFHYCACAIIGALAAVALFSPEALSLLGFGQYRDLAALVPILAASNVVGALYVFAPGLALSRSTGTIAAVNIASGVSNLVLNFLLIPHLGLLGAALATLAANTMAFLAYATFGQKHYSIKFAPLRLVSATGIATALVVGATLLSHQIHAAPAVSIVVRSGMLVAILVLVSLVMLGPLTVRHVLRRATAAGVESCRRVVAPRSQQSSVHSVKLSEHSAETLGRGSG